MRRERPVRRRAARPCSTSTRRSRPRWTTPCATTRFPLVVAGNCNVTLGVRAGLQRGGDGDAGLGLARRARRLQHAGDHRDRLPRRHAAGHALRPRLPRGGGARARCASRCDEAAVVHAGGRDFDREERRCAARLARCASWTAASCASRGPAEALAPALDALAEERRGATGLDPDDAPPAHLHVDLDVLDPAAAPGVTFPSPRRLSAAQLLEAIELVRERFALVGAHGDLVHPGPATRPGPRSPPASPCCSASTTELASAGPRRDAAR